MINELTKLDTHRTLRIARRTRDEAARRLECIQKLQNAQQRYIPAIATAITIELLDVIDRENEKIDELVAQYGEPGKEYYVQKAFSFLFECSISADEIPF